LFKKKENAAPNSLAAGIGLKRKREDDPFVKVTKPTLSSQSRVAATLKAAAPSAAAKKPTTSLAKSGTILRTTTVTKPTVGYVHLLLNLEQFLMKIAEQLHDQPLLSLPWPRQQLNEEPQWLVEPLALVGTSRSVSRVEAKFPI
jgi:hypothetical protein